MNYKFIGENLRILYKKTLEYKVNLWAAIIVQIFFLAGMLSFFYVLSNEFGSIINWNSFDFLVFLIIIDSVWNVAGIIIWNKDLSKDIINGNLNQILTKPINSLFYFLFNEFAVIAIIMNIVNLPIIIYVIMNLNIELKTGLILFGIFIVLVILTIQFILFLSTFNFYFISANKITRPIYSEGRKMLKNFPFQFFEKTNIKFIFFIWGSLYISSLMMPIIKGTQIWNLQLQIIILLCTFILFLIGIIVNWYFGLKKYNGFN